jgi:hypothetical protein
MNTTTKILALLTLTALSLGFLQSCKNKEPSIIKIYVRTESNAVAVGVKVILIGDQSSDPKTNAFVDTLVTNESGFAEFNMEDHFSEGDKDYEVGYYRVIAKTPAKYGEGYVRARVHTTAVETVFIQ